MNFDLPELTAATPAGVLCQVKVNDLKPTQNAVGFDNWILKDKIRGSDILISNLPDKHKKDIIDEAIRLARSPEAASMPGYLGPN